MPLSDAFLDQQRQQTDPRAETFVREALAQDAELFWRFISHLEETCLPEAMAPLIERHFPDYDTPPEDLSPQLTKLSSRFFEAHAEAIFLLLGTYSLPYCYAAEAGVQVLYQTHYLRDRTLKRLQETGQFIFNVAESGAFEEGGKGWLSILKVRLMHAAVRVKIGQHMKWDASKWGQPINQEDMVGTLFSFSLTVLLGLRKLGYPIEEAEAEAYFWRWNIIGKRLGVQAEMLPDDQAQAFALMKRIERRHMRPSEAGRALTKILIRETEKSADGQLPPGFVSAMMRYLLGEKIARCVGLENSVSWADPIIQLNFLRQKYFTSEKNLSPESLKRQYAEVKQRLLEVA